MIIWLEKQRVINLLLVVGYVSFLLFAHSAFVSISVAVMNHFSLAVYDRLVAAILILLGLGAVGAVISVLRISQVEYRFGVFFGLTLLLLVVHFFVLTEMNIEFIHAIMYGGLALLLFPLVGRFGGAVVLTLPIMLIDEWYQYAILFPHYTYFFELNDIVLNLLGAGLFTSLLGLLRAKSMKKSSAVLKRGEVLFFVSFVLVTIILWCACIIVSYTANACPNTWLVLNKLPELTEFWYVHPTIGSIFHILKPIEGLFVAFSLCLFYLGMDFQKK